MKFVLKTTVYGWLWQCYKKQLDRMVMVNHVEWSKEGKDAKQFRYFSPQIKFCCENKQNYVDIHLRIKRTDHKNIKVRPKNFTWGLTYQKCSLAKASVKKNRGASMEYIDTWVPYIGVGEGEVDVPKFFAYAGHFFPVVMA